MKPIAPTNLADVSTWTEAQLAYAAPIIVTKAVAAASECYADARNADAYGSLDAKRIAVGFASIGHRHMKAVLFWQQVQLGNKPKIPVFLKSQRVSSYEQMNKRVRIAKTRYAGPKDWGIWSNS